MSRGLRKNTKHFHGLPHKLSNLFKLFFNYAVAVLSTLLCKKWHNNSTVNEKRYLASNFKPTILNITMIIKNP